MTDKETTLSLINKMGAKVIYEAENYIEIENPCNGENISFEFNSVGDLLRIYS